MADTFPGVATFQFREVDFKRPAAQPLAETLKPIPGLSPIPTPLPIPIPFPLTFLDPKLGPLAAFVGTWHGRGFNTIFRPENTHTPTFPPPLNSSDNVLELNLTEETLSFSKPLGSVPNRGSGPQGDVFLNGVPYVQTIDDVTSPPSNGIHFEPGLWLAVPSTTHPNAPPTLARMASIPHGTTIVAQGVVIASVANGPHFDPVDITPFVPGNPGNKVTFPSQTATNATTARLPQNLAPFIAAGTITQAMLTDPNTVLRDQVAHQTITETVVIGISTSPGAPLPGGPLPSPPTPLPPTFGGGPANIAFLLGQANPPPSGQGPNAQTIQMDAVFWIETVVYDVVVPVLPEGSAPIVLQPTVSDPKMLHPSFVAAIPFVPGKHFAGGTIKVATTQIQYTQKVMLNFAGLTWPHVSVATLVPADPIPIPESLLPLT